MAHVIQGKPLLNGMFAVSKQETVRNLELCRLIMNLKPLNANCRALEADTGTLPAITQLGALLFLLVQCALGLGAVHGVWKGYPSWYS